MFLPMCPLMSGLKNQGSVDVIALKQPFNYKVANTVNVRT